MIFASEDDLRYLAKQNHWYCDGTFYTSPSIFYEIYSIHAYDEGLSTPCVFGLLADKFETTYQDFFMILISKMKELCNAIQIKTVTIDFELSVKSVFEKNLPNVQVRIKALHFFSKTKKKLQFL